MSIITDTKQIFYEKRAETILGTLTLIVIISGCWLYCYNHNISQDSLEPRTFYFFSTFAQVWAALMAFGGILLRDRIRFYHEDMNEYFSAILNLVDVKDIRDWLSGNTEGYSSEIFI